MNVPELLTHLGSEQLRYLARVIGSGDSSPSARTLLQDLIRAYRDPRVLKDNLKLLEAPTREFLTILIRFVGRDGTGFHVPPSLAESWGGEKATGVHLENLLNFGLIFHAPGSHTAGEGRKGSKGRPHGYIIPRDLGDALLGILDEQDDKGSQSATVAVEDSRAFVPQAVRELTYALLRLLVLTRRGKVRITNSGRAAKRSVDLWADSLPADSFPRALPFVTNGKSGAVAEPDIFEFLLDFTFEADLIRQHGGEAASTKRVDRWLDLPAELLLNQIASHYVRQKIYPSRPHQYAAAALLAAPDWTDPRALTAPLRARFRTTSGEQDLGAEGGGIGSDDDPQATAPEEKAAERIVDELTAYLAVCGLLETATGEGVVAVRRKSDATEIELASRKALDLENAQALRDIDEVSKEEARARISPAILQPTYELMVPPGTPIATLWRIESFADFEAADVMSTYRVSRASYTRALREGYTPDGIAGMIQQYAPGPMPQNVAFSLRDWGQRYGQIEMRRGVFLRCQDADLASEIQHIPELRVLIAEALSEDVLLVKEGREEELFERLEQLDYSPRTMM